MTLTDEFEHEPGIHVFIVGETQVPRGNPCKHRENMPTPQNCLMSTLSNKRFCNNQFLIFIITIVPVRIRNLSICIQILLVIKGITQA